MTITNTWTVVQMNCYPKVNGETDVVFTVHWTLSATDGTYNGGAYGSVAMTLNPDEPFIPYADLTEAEVIGWVQSALGAEQVAEYEAAVAQQLEAQINPPVITPPLPWS